MTTLSVARKTGATVQIMKHAAGYNNVEEFMDDVVAYLAENWDDFVGGFRERCAPTLDSDGKPL